MTAIEQANRYIQEVEQDYLDCLWDAYYYVATIPSTNKSEYDNEWEDQLLDEIELTQIRMGIRHPNNTTPNT